MLPPIFSNMTSPVHSPGDPLKTYRFYAAVIALATADIFLPMKKFRRKK